MKKFAAYLLLSIMLLPVVSARADETALPSVGAALELPEGFDGIAVESGVGMSVFQVIHPDTGDQILVLPPFGEEDTQTVLRKVRDKSSGFVSREGAYGTHEYIVYANRNDLGRITLVLSGERRGLRVDVDARTPGEPAYLTELLASLRGV